MLRIKTKQIISVQDWDALVAETYGRPYSLQQQDGCVSRQMMPISVPSDGYDFKNESVPEIVNHEKMGVSFAAWLARSPEKPLENGATGWELGLWWDRNFYPCLDMVVDDLHRKGLLPAGEYLIDIDW